MRLINRIRLLLWILVIAGAGTAYLDYDRLVQGELPVFCKTTYNEKTKVETFRGLFYVAERTVKHNTKERLELSSNVKYSFLHKTLKIKDKHPQTTYDFVLYVTPSLSCPTPARVYAELEDKNVYIDCIASIRIKNKKEKESKDLGETIKEDPTIIDEIINNVTFTGIDKDKTTEHYMTTDDTFSNKQLYIYRCHGNNSRNVYITMNPNKLDSYCK